MMHDKRRWCLRAVEDAATLARMLTDRTHTLCAAYFVAGREDYVFLNDSTSEDGALEFAAVKRLQDESFLQVNTITFSWTTEDQARAIIHDVLAGCDDSASWAFPVLPRLETEQQHGRCRFCE